MKIYRIVILFAVVLAVMLVTWALGHEHVGTQEAHAIEASAP